MKTALFQLRSKVSRRILMTVFLCSILPITGLVCLTFYNVQTKASEDVNRRLHHASKNVGMAIMAELGSLHQNLKNEAALRNFGHGEKIIIDHDTQKTSEKPFITSWFFSEHKITVKGLPPLTETIRERLATGLPQLEIMRDRQETALLLWAPVRDQNNVNGIAVGKINPDYLWLYAEGFLPSHTRLAIVDEQYQPLLQGVGKLSIEPALIQLMQKRKETYFETDVADQHWLIGQWQLFLLAGFNAEGWHILVGEPKNEAFSSLSSFQKNAGLTGIITVWIILLASSILIRKTLKPLQQLKEATQQVGRGRFDFHLNIASQDEFGLLSSSFNSMVDKIQQQITRQKQMGIAVREVLSAGGEDEIIQNFFNGLAQITTMDVACLTVFKRSPFDIRKIGSSWTCQLQKNTHLDIDWSTEVSRAEVDSLIEDQGLFTYATPKEFPCLLKPVAAINPQHHLLFHININHDTEAVLILADRLHIAEEELISNVRQLADQLGVALSRSATVHELDALNIGVLTALARTVDANSKWTHGHSERVTEYALIIAKELGFSEKEKDDLHHAGLLHDLGKVSIPAEILNKAGKLTEAEYNLMKAHPGEGERIIEPIKAFKSICPIVRQHHERWDGKGYPDGLKGEEIHLGARTLAVADVYDALYSDRPYRAGWPQEKVIDYLKQEAGKAFDPVVVQALLRSLPKLAA